MSFDVIIPIDTQGKFPLLLHNKVETIKKINTLVPLPPSTSLTHANFMHRRLIDS